MPQQQRIIFLKYHNGKNGTFSVTRSGWPVPTVFQEHTGRDTSTEAMARASSLSYPQDLYLLLPSSVDLHKSVLSDLLFQRSCPPQIYVMHVSLNSHERTDSVVDRQIPCHWIGHALVSLNSHERTDWFTGRFLVIGLVRWSERMNDTGLNGWLPNGWLGVKLN